MDIDDGMGLGQLVAQPFVLPREFGDAPGFGDCRIGFAPALLWFKPGAFGGLTLLAPRCQLRGIDAFAT